MKLFKHLFAILLIVGVAFMFGCQKDNPGPNTGGTGTGSGSGTPSVPYYELRFVNTSSNPYKIEVDGNVNVVQGNTFRNYNLKKGTYAWQVTQQSGYLLYPTVQNGTITLNGDKTIVFP